VVNKNFWMYGVLKINIKLNNQICLQIVLSFIIVQPRFPFPQVLIWCYIPKFWLMKSRVTICKQIWLFNLILIFNTPYIQKYLLTTMNTRSFVCSELYFFIC
jgi:hypothetical protein